MAGLDPAILLLRPPEDNRWCGSNEEDGRVKPGHDGGIWLRHA